MDFDMKMRIDRGLTILENLANQPTTTTNSADMMPIRDGLFRLSEAIENSVNSIILELEQQRLGQ